MNNGSLLEGLTMLIVLIALSLTTPFLKTYHFIHSGALASSYLTWFPWTGLERINVTQ